MGIPVVIAENGQGIPVKPVEDNAPVMTVAENGLGAPIVISELGAPFIVEGVVPPIEWNWQTFSMTNGGDGVQWVGYSVGGDTLPNPAFGSISNEPTDKATLLAFYQDTASGVVLAVFSGEWETELAGLEVSLGGLVLYPFEIEVISGNTWLRYDGMPGLWTEGVVYEVLFGWGLEPVFDPSSEALFARFTTPPTDGRKWLINNLIVSLKDADVWSKLDAFYVMAAANAQAARQNWIANTYNLTAVSAPVFTTDRGYAGDGVSSYLGTGFTPSTAVGAKYLKDSANIGSWSRTDNAIAGSREITSNGSAIAYIEPRSGSIFRIRINDASPTGSLEAASSSSLGHFVASRTGASARASYRDGAMAASDTGASTNLPNVEIRIGPAPSTRQVAAAHFGAGLTATDVDNLHSALESYLQAVGAV